MPHDDYTKIRYFLGPVRSLQLNGCEAEHFSNSNSNSNSRQPWSTKEKKTRLGQKLRKGGGRKEPFVFFSP